MIAAIKDVFATVNSKGETYDEIKELNCIKRSSLFKRRSPTRYFWQKPLQAYLGRALQIRINHTSSLVKLRFLMFCQRSVKT